MELSRGKLLVSALVSSWLTLTLVPKGEAAPGLDKDRAIEIAFEYLQGHRASLGLAASDIADVVVSDAYLSRHTGTHHVFLQQRLHGVKIRNALLNLAVSKDGIVAHLGHRFASKIVGNASRSTPRITALEAVDFAAEALGLAAPLDLVVLEGGSGSDRGARLSGGEVSQEDIPVRLVYQQVAGGQLQLAWDVTILQLDGLHWWSTRIDAESGSLLDKNDLFADAQYEVYPIPVESPNHTMPPPEGRMIEEDPQNDSSPCGWHDTVWHQPAGYDTAWNDFSCMDVPEFTITRGNNVHAYADADGNNFPDGGVNAEPDGGTSLDFTGNVVPLNLAGQPSTYTQASIANLFYWINVAHDVLYNYGFDEQAGNFQFNNYGNGGDPRDPVLAEAQDTNAGNCNANFGTPRDGNSPRMQISTCDDVWPFRDGSFDHGVILHEYGHGVSNRLVGGPSNVGCLNNAEQMGEGWSDYLGLMLTMEAGDTGTDRRGFGTYFIGQQPEEQGMRRAPYSTDPAVNNYNYSNISDFNCGDNCAEDVGFVWATMLWEMTWELIEKYGLNPDIYDDWQEDSGPVSGGNNLALQLVMDGMKRQNCNPGFVDARNAILMADDHLTGDAKVPHSGKNQLLIWEAFARRGLGVYARQGSPNNLNDGKHDFSFPATCELICSGKCPECVFEDSFESGDLKRW